MITNIRVKIRRFKKSDLQKILDMTKECWNGFSFDQKIEKIFGRRGKAWWELKRDSIKGFLESHPEWCFVAEIEGNVVGYATYSIDETRKVGHVLNNAVHPQWRGKGIGSALHERVLEKLKNQGMEVAILVTSVQNVPARRMYESHGFKVVWEALYYARSLSSEE
ncbi:TPA: GNAT family N-acetyltransferase [Candidatus Bathyarchaeota archaeon]|nr:GNAT family N-acetyltransferase [Candidatus Bathyarchaeota archaeon]